MSKLLKSKIGLSKNSVTDIPNSLIINAIVLKLEDFILLFIIALNNRDKIKMTLNQAFAIRVREILKEKGMTQYKLEQLTGLYHSTMNAMMNNIILEFIF